jgi:hypothetical protein
MGLLVSNPDINNPCNCAGTMTTCAHFEGAYRFWPNGEYPGPISPLVNWIVADSPVNPLKPPLDCAPRLSFSVPIINYDTEYGDGPQIVAQSSGQLAADGATVGWTFSVTYDGSTIISESGSDHVTANKELFFMMLDPTGWVRNSTWWQYDFSGPASNNPNPVIYQNLSITLDIGLYEFETWLAPTFYGE